MVKRAGVKIGVGGREFMLPPLNVAVLEEHEASYRLVLDATQQGRIPDPELMRAIAELVFASLADAGADVTERHVKQAVTVPSAVEWIHALMAQSGFPEADKDTPEGKATSP